MNPILRPHFTPAHRAAGLGLTACLDFKAPGSPAVLSAAVRGASRA